MTWNLAYFPAAVAAGSGNGVPAGIFIPQADLPGITTAAELGNPNQERKVAYSICNRVHDALAGIPTKLGISNSRSMSTGALDRINQSFLLTVLFVANHVDNTLSVLPLPGSNAGRVSLSALFPAAAIVGAEGAVPGPGVVVPSVLITENGGSVPGAVANDARSWLNALYQSMVLGLEPSEAVISPSRSSATGSTPAADFTGAGATTGLDADDLSRLSFFSLTYSVTLQISLNQSTQTFDLAA